MDGMHNLLVYISVFMVVFLPYVFVSFFLNKPKVAIGDLDSRNIPPLFRRLWGILSCFSETAGALVGVRMPKRTKKLSQALVAANIRMETDYIYAAEMLLCVLGGVGGVLLFLCITTRGDVVFGFSLLFALLGWLWPSTTIYGLAERRQTAIMHALPFSIDLIGSAMRSGIDFTAAVRYYVSTEDSRSPLALEYGIMLRQLDLGKTRMQALEDMTERIQTDAFRAFAEAVIHGMEVGASITETMRIQAEEMRRVRFNIAERKAARAASSMILPIAIFIMPAMFLIIGTPVIMRVMRSGLGGLMK